MVFDGLRKKLRSVASSGSESAREAPERVREVSAETSRAVARRAPSTGLEGNRKPEPTTGERIARRLQVSGQMRKPIGDANLEPGADPRYMERFGRGDATTGEWFGESEAPADPHTTYFARGETPENVEFGPFVQEMLDERDHEGGHYAYEDEHERGMLDDGVDVGVQGVEMKW